MSAAAVLHILKNGETIKSLPVEGEISVGRGDGCVVRLDDRAISRNHAMIRPFQGGFQIEKQSGFGALSVNGADTEQAQLKDGDVVQLGPYLLKLQVAAVGQVSSENAKNSAPPPVADFAVESVPSDSSQNPPAAPLATTTDFAVSTSDSNIDLSLNQPENQQSAPAFTSPIPDAIAPEPVSDFANPDDDGRTKLTTSANVNVKLIFPPGAANHSEFQITKDEVSLGRGKNCDVVLEDKKASRKHIIIRRVGLNFTIKDLESANGTWVNGVQINEQELSGDDTIQIGDTVFQFKVQSGDYNEQEQQGFAQVEDQGAFEYPPQESMQAMDGYAAMGVSNGMEPMPGEMQTSDSGIPLITGINPEASGKKPTLYEKYIRDFKKLNPRQKVLTLFVGLGLVYFVFIEEDEEQVAARRPAAVQGQGQLPTFEQLNLQQKQFVDSQYNLAWDHYQKQEYEKALYEIQKIFTMVRDYKNAKELAHYSTEKKKLAERAEEDRKRQEQEAQIKANINRKVEELRAIMAAKEFEKADALFSEVLALDPDNQEVLGFKREIMAWHEAKAIEEQKKRIEEQRNNQGKALFAEVIDMLKSKDYHGALEKIDEITDLNVTDKKLKSDVLAKEKFCIQQIDKRKRPALKAAQAAERNRQYGKAYRFYREVAEIDPLGSEGPDGIERVRGQLHEMAKASYAEGILAENFSDLVTARKKFEEILKNTPEDDRYYTSAKRRLEKYGFLDQAIASVEAPKKEEAGPSDGLSPADAALTQEALSRPEETLDPGLDPGLNDREPASGAADSDGSGVPEPPEFPESGR